MSFKKIKIKGHINYQLCVKVDKLFEKLLDNKEINLYNRKRVMDICRDWYNINQSKANLENFFIMKYKDTYLLKDVYDVRRGIK